MSPNAYARARGRREGSLSDITYLFGSWNAAVRAAGLRPNPPAKSARRRLTDEALLAEIQRVAGTVGGPPSERAFARHARLSLAPYKDR
jgi:hypothetical protein